MKVIEDAARVREWTEAYRRAGLSVGFVPTMGALHEGHGELIRVSREECERVVVSIYVNPTQFDNPDDLDKYPSALEGDLEACRARGVDLVWIGRREDLLPEGFQTWVEVGSLTSPLCGAGRPGHFRGVTTVVAQLLHVVRPHRAYFGRKDFQQALVIRRMVEDLRFDLEIRRVLTVREPDGHALSSRNLRLDEAERQTALAIQRALRLLAARFEEGERSVGELTRHLRGAFASEPRLRVEYAELRDADTLELCQEPDSIPDEPGRVLVAVAAQVGGVRLIDSILLGDTSADFPSDPSPNDRDDEPT